MNLNELYKQAYYKNKFGMILCGDCVEIMRKMDDACIDLTVTSPPYDNLRTYNGYCFDFENVAKELYRVTKDGGVVVWVVGDATIKGSETGTSFRQALYFMECGFNLHDTMIYQKMVRERVEATSVIGKHLSICLYFQKEKSKLLIGLQPKLP